MQLSAKMSTRLISYTGWMDKMTHQKCTSVDVANIDKTTLSDQLYCRSTMAFSYTLSPSINLHKDICSLHVQ